jgi:hypothetical protein
MNTNRNPNRWGIIVLQGKKVRQVVEDELFVGGTDIRFNLSKSSIEVRGKSFKG